MSWSFFSMFHVEISAGHVRSSSFDHSISKKIVNCQDCEAAADPRKCLKQTWVDFPIGNTVSELFLLVAGESDSYFRSPNYLQLVYITAIGAIQFIFCFCFLLLSCHWVLWMCMTDLLNFYHGLPWRSWEHPTVGDTCGDTFSFITQYYIPTSPQKLAS